MSTRRVFFCARIQLAAEAGPRLVRAVAESAADEADTFSISASTGGGITNIWERRRTDPEGLLSW